VIEPVTNHFQSEPSYIYKFVLPYDADATNIPACPFGKVSTGVNLISYI